MASTQGLELKAEKVKPYLKMITEAIAFDSSNKGTYRRDIWEYLQRKFAKVIDYKEFLIAMKKFLAEGKIINNGSEGLYSMHPEVMKEVRVNTPTPALKKEGLLKDNSGSLETKGSRTSISAKKQKPGKSPR